MPAALLVTRNPCVEQVVEGALANAGYEVVCADAAEAGLKAMLTVRVSTVVLDSSLGIDELETISEWIRSREDGAFGIVFLMSVRTRPASLPIDPERDELVVKPFTPEQVRLAAERAAAASKRTRPDTLLVGQIELDRRTLELREDDLKVTLTPSEFRLIEYLAQHKGKWVATKELSENVWERRGDSKAANLVRNHVQNLRSKLSGLPNGEEILESRPHRGYRLA